MTELLNKLKSHKFEAHLAILLAMVLASLGLYFAARQDATSWMLGLLGLFALANALALLIA